MEYFKRSISLTGFKKQNPWKTRLINYSTLKLKQFCEEDIMNKVKRLTQTETYFATYILTSKKERREMGKGYEQTIHRSVTSW